MRREMYGSKIMTASQYQRAHSALHLPRASHTGIDKNHQKDIRPLTLSRLRGYCPVGTLQVRPVEYAGFIRTEASALASDFMCPYPTTAMTCPVVRYMRSRILATMCSSRASSSNLLSSG